MASSSPTHDSSTTGSSTEVAMDVSTPIGLSKRKMDDRSPIESESPDLKKSNVSDTSQVMDMKAFSDMVSKTFNDKGFVQSVTPLLFDLMSPLIRDCIGAAVGALKESVINPLVESNKELIETVKFQSDTIEEQKKSLDTKSKQIDKLEKELKSVYARVDSLSSETNDLEQYSRRNSLRLYNLPVPDDITTEQQLTDLVLRFINCNILKLSNSSDPTALTSLDIERCHYAGRGKRQLLIKFSRYHTKRRVFMNKANLKQNADKIFLSEDLTKYNHNLVMELRERYLQRAVCSYWTRDGSIFVKKGKDDVAVKIRSGNDISELFKRR